MALHELQLLLQNHGLTVGQSWALIGYVCGACFGLMWLFKIALDKLEDYRAVRAQRRHIAQLLHRERTLRSIAEHRFTKAVR